MSESDSLVSDCDIEEIPQVDKYIELLKSCYHDELVQLKEKMRLKEEKQHQCPLVLKKLISVNTILTENWTTSSHNKILIAFENFLAIYDYELDKYEPLLGHVNRVACIAIDGSGTYFVSSDVGKDSRVIVWDAEKRLPLLEIKNVSENGCSFVKFCHCSKYLLTVSCSPENGENIKFISFWEWTYLRSYPHATIEVDETSYGCFRSVDFCFENCEYCMLTTEKEVYFLTIETINEEAEQNESKQISFYKPKCTGKKSHTGFNSASSYIQGSDLAITGTVTGHLIVWSNIDWDQENSAAIDENETNKQFSNNKNLFMVIKIDHKPICSIFNIDRFVVTINSLGHIRFYDNDLLLIHKIDDVGSGYVVSISFNLNKGEPFLEDHDEDFASQYEINKFKKYRSQLLDGGKKLRYEASPISYDDGQSRRNVSEWKARKNSIRYITVSSEKKFLDIRDFILITSEGDILYHNISHDSVYEVLKLVFNKATAIDSHPTNNHICIGTNWGMIFIYDYSIQVVLKRNNVNSYKSGNECSKENILERDDGSCIMCLKYSLDGAVIACGMVNGTVYLIEGKSLQVLAKMKNSVSPIVKIMYANYGSHFGFYDRDSHVVVYSWGREVEYVQRDRQHFKPITDLQFMLIPENYYEMYTIAEDQYLVGYRMPLCGVAGENTKSVFTKILSERIEDFAFPTSLQVMSDSPSILMIFNSEMKCKFFNAKTMTVFRIVQAPICGAVSLTKYLSTDYLLYAASNHIGLLKCPLDGNPYKMINCSAGSSKVVSVCLNANKSNIFSLTENGTLVMWNVDTVKFEKYEAEGGSRPFLKALFQDPMVPGLKDIEFLFRAVQHAYKFLTKSYLSNSLPLVAIPTFLRGLGHYPTINEENIIFKQFCVSCKIGEDCSCVEVKGIPFDACLQIFWNYRCPGRFSEAKIQQAFENISDVISTEQGFEASYIPTKDFINFLKQDDTFSLHQIYHYFRALINPLKKDEEDKILKECELLHKSLPTEEGLLIDYLCKIMPEKITLDYLRDTLIGVQEGNHNFEEI